MSNAQHPSNGTQPPTSPKGHPLPRRSSPENSITLRNHRLAHEASAKALSMRAAAAAAAATSSGSSSHRHSSGESHNTGPSDPKKWFEQSNENPTALYSNTIDVDPPFFQKESDSSHEGNLPPASYPSHLRPPMAGTLKPSATHSSSADDYRSVIDDLTVEIKRLKDELKRYKQKGPEMMKQDRLFEIKVHGLPKRKKRELESTLRDFASGLESSTPSAETSSAHNKGSHKVRLVSGSGSTSKHASSTSGSHSRPVDSAYASMSTGANSSGTSLARPSISSRAKSSEQKVENYLKDIPEGLYPRHMVMTDKDKKKLIVRRLEQIFTGKISGRSVNRHQPKSSGNIASYAPIMVEPATGNTTTTHGPSNVPMGFHEPSREARILGLDEGKNPAKDNGSTSNSNGDQLDSGGNSAVAGTSPPDPPFPDQRPTRPLDLDPDRKQNPTANMDYIRHLGLAPPHLTGLATYEDVSPDADGWVYLNLICNMAQLHMLNVAPDYIRSAVSEKSTKFQLSSDGRKIRWRGGTDGTKFSSDSSGETSHTSRSEESDAANDEHTKKRKRRQASKSGMYSYSADPNSSDQLKFDQQLSSVDSFHYKPLFVHQSSSAEQTSLDDSNSSGGGEDSNNGASRWGNSGSGSARRKRRRLDGAIIYYSGAPFCMDLSGDPGDLSPSSYLTSTGQEQQSPTSERERPGPQRTQSGSALPYRPLTDGTKAFSVAVATEMGSEDSDMDIEAEFPWSDRATDPVPNTLDASGFGGVNPDDHFRVIATTRRPKINANPSSSSGLERSDVTKLVDRIMSPLRSSPQVGLSKPKSKSHLPVTIEYTSESVVKLKPTPLPPPGMYFSFDSDSSETSAEDLSEPEDEPMALAGSIGIQGHPPTFENQYPDDVDMSSGDEEDVEPDDGDEPVGKVDDDSSEGFEIPNLPRAVDRASSSSAVAAAGTARSRSKSCSAELPLATGSSVATAGGAESGYSSSREESG
ncbi:hypothetical protein LY76DRAFT_501569 [Colletotrichum caudatum]|nr:hypothetical protein LY76DRAFT_501569 [Colletotrichum caudatum]